MDNGKSKLRPFAALTAVWIAAGLALRFFEAWRDPFLVILAPLLWSFSGLCLLLFLLWRIWKARRPRGPLIAAATIALAWAMVVFAGDPVGWAGTKWRFGQLKPDYLALIAELREDPGLDDDNWRSAAFGSYRVSAGPSLRVAFLWPGGAIDNWSGVIYDPTGFVMEANRFKADFSNWFDPDLAEVKGVFPGETLFGCRPLEGPFYFCWFT